MPAIEWNDAYSVGLEKMDTQHKQLFAAINALYDAMAVAMPDRQRTLACFEFLREYTLTHFAEEEALMRDHAYEGIDAHLAEHQKLIDRLQDFERRLQQTQADPFVDDDVVMFLVGDWLLQHVMEHDQLYARALRADLIVQPERQE